MLLWYFIKNLFAKISFSGKLQLLVLLQLLLVLLFRNVIWRIAYSACKLF